MPVRTGIMTGMGTRMLAENHLNAQKLDVDPVHEFYVSDGAEKFKIFANSILPYDIKTTHVINIEEY